MHYNFLSSIFFLFVSCKETTQLTHTTYDIVGEVAKKENVPKSIGFTIQKRPDTISYTATKNEIAVVKRLLRKGFDQKKITLDSVQTIFTELLVDRIIPYWYGTEWAFEGHTSIPNKGEIACGYFVSTTLKDVGVKLNRYQLAQKSPIDEATFLSCGTPVFTIIKDYKKAISILQEYTTDGIYFIGLDEGHVGYLLKRKQYLFLIHSNYLDPSEVIIEPIRRSQVFKGFNRFYIIPISNNEVLINKWLRDENI